VLRICLWIKEETVKLHTGKLAPRAEFQQISVQCKVGPLNFCPEFECATLKVVSFQSLKVFKNKYEDSSLRYNLNKTRLTKLAF
jgi:hypothetical protein